jgi:hypothetical protein
MGLLYDYHELLILGFVKVTDGYVEKAEPIFTTLPFNLKILYYSSHPDSPCISDTAKLLNRKVRSLTLRSV